MDEELKKMMEIQDRKLDEIYRSAEKTRKYFLLTLVATAVCFFVPLIGLMVVIPQVINYYGQALKLLN